MGLSEGAVLIANGDTLPVVALLPPPPLDREGLELPVVGMETACDFKEGADGEEDVVEGEELPKRPAKKSGSCKLKFGVREEQ